MVDNNNDDDETMDRDVGSKEDTSRDSMARSYTEQPEVQEAHQNNENYGRTNDDESQAEMVVDEIAGIRESSSSSSSSLVLPNVDSEREPQDYNCDLDDALFESLVREADEEIEKAKMENKQVGLTVSKMIRRTRQQLELEPINQCKGFCLYLVISRLLFIFQVEEIERGLEALRFLARRKENQHIIDFGKTL